MDLRKTYTGKSKKRWRSLKVKITMVLALVALGLIVFALQERSLGFWLYLLRDAN